jgi:hypothetical protein
VIAPGASLLFVPPIETHVSSQLILLRISGLSIAAENLSASTSETA